MGIIQKIKIFAPKKRRAVIAIIVIILALPLLFFIFTNFADRMSKIKDNIKVEEIKLPK